MISENCAASLERSATLLLFFGLGIVAVSGTSFSTASAQSAVERPPTFSASQLLRGQNLTGPNYQISETVQNDGFLNHYTVTVEGRSYNVAGNATMRERLRELRALQRMEAMKRTDVYKKALKKSALGPLSTAKNLIMSPVSTIKGIGSGIGSMFSSVGHSLFGGASDQEEGVLKTAIGFAAAKRKFAHRFGIDPYTSFPPVKERLDEIAWSGVAGGLTVAVGFAAIPGVGGTVVSTTKTSDTMNNVIRDNTPAELKKNDGRKLRAMGVHKSVAAIFLEHPKYSPSERTRLVSALASVAATGREEFIQRASLAANETMAIFLRRWAEMIAAYNRRIQPVKRIIRIGKAPFAQRADGVLVGLFPIDYLAWTSSIARRHATNMKSLPGVSGVTAGEIWLEGSISPKAKQALIAQNWVVNEYTGAALGLK
jgi:hypothetical protein